MCDCQQHPRTLRARFIEGAGADVLQSDAARRRTQSHAIDHPASGMRVTPGHNVATTDFAALQQFPQRPTLTSIVGGSVANAQQVPMVPGRLPPAGWGGENDATSPFANFGAAV